MERRIVGIVYRNIFLILSLLLLAGCYKHIRIGRKYYRVDYFYSDEKAEEFVLAAKRGDVDTVDQYLTEGFDIDIPGRDGVTPMYLMMLSDNLDGFRLLIERGADPNMIVQGAPSIVNMSLYRESDDYLYLILEHGGNYLRRVPNREIPFISAMSNLVDIRKLEILLEHGIDPNFSYNLGSNPVIDALIGREYRRVIMLFEYGADILENEELREFFIKDMESYEQFAGTQQFEEQKELVAYLKEKFDLEIRLKSPEGRKLED